MDEKSKSTEEDSRLKLPTIQGQISPTDLSPISDVLGNSLKSTVHISQLFGGIADSGDLLKVTTGSFVPPVLLGSSDLVLPSSSSMTVPTSVGSYADLLSSKITADRLNLSGTGIGDALSNQEMMASMNLLVPSVQPTESVADVVKKETHGLQEDNKKIVKKLEEIEKTGLAKEQVYSFVPKRLITDNPLEKSSFIRNFFQKIEAVSGWVNWRCAFCGKFLCDKLSSYSAAQEYYRAFVEGRYETCGTCGSANFFLVQDELISFHCIQSLGKDPQPHVSVSKKGWKKPLTKE